MSGRDRHFSMVRSALLALLSLLASVTSSASVQARLSFNVNFVDDASGTFASRGWLSPDSLFQKNIRAALDQWGARVASNRTLVVRVDTTSYSARAGGSFSYGRLLYTNGQGKQVWEVGSLTRILTGSNPGATTYGYDIVLGFDANFVQQFYWFDQQPELRTAPVPSDKGDFVSVVLHELGHGLGIGGNRDFASGQLLTAAISQFDDLSYYGGAGFPFDFQGEPSPLFFGGDQAALVYGADLPLTHRPAGDPNYGQNFYHLSACDPEAPDGLETTLMNGCVLPNGQRLYITKYELAVLADLGYPLAQLSSADFNTDGRVDSTDFKRWKLALGAGGADADQDGDSDGVDFLYWQRQFNPTTMTASTVPEPLGGVLTVIALVVVDNCRRESARRPAARG